MIALNKEPVTCESALDTLKLTVQIVDNLIDVAQDQLASAETEHDVAQEVLDSARRELWLALSAHVEGIRPEHPHYDGDSRRRALTYDDGSPVQQSIELRDGSIATYSPRRDGDRDAFIEFISAGCRPHLYAVPVGGDI